MPVCVLLSLPPTSTLFLGIQNIFSCFTCFMGVKGNSASSFCLTITRGPVYSTTPLLYRVERNFYKTVTTPGSTEILSIVTLCSWIPQIPVGVLPYVPSPDCAWRRVRKRNIPAVSVPVHITAFHQGTSLPQRQNCLVWYISQLWLTRSSKSIMFLFNLKTHAFWDLGCWNSRTWVLITQNKPLKCNHQESDSFLH